MSLDDPMLDHRLAPRAVVARSSTSLCMVAGVRFNDVARAAFVYDLAAPTPWRRIDLRHDVRDVRATPDGYLALCGQRLQIIEGTTCDVPDLDVASSSAVRRRSRSPVTSCDSLATSPSLEAIIYSVAG